VPPFNKIRQTDFGRLLQHLGFQSQAATSVVLFCPAAAVVLNGFSLWSGYKLIIVICIGFKSTD